MKRNDVLALLRAHTGEYVSGEQISASLGITRAAIWKTMESLRKDGWEIESKPGVGYRLAALPEKITAERVAACLKDDVRIGRHIEYFETLDSTNNYAKQAALSGAEDGLVVIANSQSGGRGRSGRSFQSPPDMGLYLTALLRPPIPPSDALPITALAALAACDAIERVCAVRPAIKWTNDLVLDGKKLTGILTEMGIEGESGLVQYIVIGIGINVNQCHFPEEIADKAASLRLSLGKCVDRTMLAAALIEELDRLYAALGSDLTERIAQYRRDCVTLHRRVRLIEAGSERVGEALDVDDAFGLVVRFDDGSTDTIRSGEVSVRGLYGYV